MNAILLSGLQLAILHALNQKKLNQDELWGELQEVATYNDIAREIKYLTSLPAPLLIPAAVKSKHRNSVCIDHTCFELSLEGKKHLK
jgi:hypothetical protein